MWLYLSFSLEACRREVATEFGVMSSCSAAIVFQFSSILTEACKPKASLTTGRA